MSLAAPVQLTSRLLFVLSVAGPALVDNLVGVGNVARAVMRGIAGDGIDLATAAARSSRRDVRGGIRISAVTVRNDGYAGRRVRIRDGARMIDLHPVSDLKITDRTDRNFRVPGDGARGYGRERAGRPKCCYV